MNEVTRNFWLGAAWFVTLMLLSAVVMCLLIWGDRYMEFDHSHDHSHPPHVHEHAEHKHPHQLPDHDHEHEHRHTHQLAEDNHV